MTSDDHEDIEDAVKLGFILRSQDGTVEPSQAQFDHAKADFVRSHQRAPLTNEEQAQCYRLAQRVAIEEGVNRMRSLARSLRPPTATE